MHGSTNAAGAWIAQDDCKDAGGRATPGAVAERPVPFNSIKLHKRVFALIFVQGFDVPVQYHNQIAIPSRKTLKH